MDNDEEVLNEHRKEVYAHDNINLNPQKSSANFDVLHIQRAASLDITEKGYGKVGKSGGSQRSSPYDLNDCANKTLADLISSSLQYCQGKRALEQKINAECFPLGSTNEEKKFVLEGCKSREFVNPIANDRDPMDAMLQIARNNRTETQGDIEEILKRRAKIYGDTLDPKWFTYEIDLGVQAKSMEERNKARAMLAAAPLMVAQLGAREF